MSDYEGVTPESAALATMLRHITEVRSALLRVRQDLEMRAERHDLSKFSPEEFPGFSRINATARQHPYGSEEYKVSLRAEKSTVERHTRSNSHHPEFHEAHLESWAVPHVEGVDTMGWLDVIEMVCDWWAASQTYGTTPWKEVLARQRERRNWSRGHWWLIEQVSWFLSGEPATLPQGGRHRS